MCASPLRVSLQRLHLAACPSNPKEGAHHLHHDLTEEVLLLLLGPAGRVTGYRRHLLSGEYRKEDVGKAGHSLQVLLSGLHLLCLDCLAALLVPLIKTFFYPWLARCSHSPLGIVSLRFGVSVSWGCHGSAYRGSGAS